MVPEVVVVSLLVEVVEVVVAVQNRIFIDVRYLLVLTVSESSVMPMTSKLRSSAFNFSLHKFPLNMSTLHAL